MSTEFRVAPNQSDWYYTVNVTDSYGESSYIDGYASGDEPDIESVIASLECTPHRWVAGIMAVDSEDLDSVAAVREVTCEACDLVYGQLWKPSIELYGLEVSKTSSSTRSD